MKGSGKAVHPLYDTITHGKSVEIERLNEEYNELFEPIKDALKKSNVIYSGDGVKDKKLQEKALNTLTNQIINTNIVSSETLPSFLKDPSMLLSDGAVPYVNYINEKIDPTLIKTDSGVVINFADRKARDLELGGKSDADIGMLERLGFFSRPNFDGSQGYAYGYLTDKNVAFVDQLNAPEGSFSPQEYKEIKNAVQEYTGATKVGGFRVSGARSGDMINKQQYESRGRYCR
jgi:hypothetical protein